MSDRLINQPDGQNRPFEITKFKMDLIEHTVQLADAVAELERRLDEYSTPPSPATKSDAPNPGSTKFGCELHELNCRIFAATNRIKELLGRLEL